MQDYSAMTSFGLRSISNLTKPLHCTSMSSDNTNKTSSLGQNNLTRGCSSVRFQTSSFKTYFGWSRTRIDWIWWKNFRFFYTWRNSILQNGHTDTTYTTGVQKLCTSTCITETGRIIVQYFNMTVMKNCLRRPRSINQSFGDGSSWLQVERGRGE